MDKGILLPQSRRIFGRVAFIKGTKFSGGDWLQCVSFLEVCLTEECTSLTLHVLFVMNQPLKLPHHVFLSLLKIYGVQWILILICRALRTSTMNKGFPFLPQVLQMILKETSAYCCLLWWWKTSREHGMKFFKEEAKRRLLVHITNHRSL